MLMKDLNNKTVEQLLDLIDDLKAQLFMLHFKNATGQQDQTHKIKLIKKDVARAFMAISAQKNVVPSPINKKVTSKKVSNLDLTSSDSKEKTKVVNKQGVINGSK